MSRRDRCLYRACRAPVALAGAPSLAAFPAHYGGYPAAYCAAWVCPTPGCGYTQDWCYASALTTRLEQLDWRYRAMRDAGERQR